MYKHIQFYKHIKTHVIIPIIIYHIIYYIIYYSSYYYPYYPYYPCYPCYPCYPLGLLLLMEALFEAFGFGALPVAMLTAQARATGPVPGPKG